MHLCGARYGWPWSLGLWFPRLGAWIASDFRPEEITIGPSGVAEGLLTAGAGGLTSRLVLTPGGGGPSVQLHAVDYFLSLTSALLLASPLQKPSLMNLEHTLAHIHERMNVHMYTHTHVPTLMWRISLLLSGLFLADTILHL